MDASSLSVGGTAPQALLNRIASARSLHCASGKQAPGAWPDIVITLRASQKELRDSLEACVRAYVELEDENGLSAQTVCSLIDYPKSLFFGLSTASTFSLEIAPAIVRNLVARNWLSSQRLDDAELCLHEAINNAVVHGNLGILTGPSNDPGAFGSFFNEVQSRLSDPYYARRRLGVDARLDGGWLCIGVTDEGQGHETAMPAPLDAPLEAKSGRGMLIMRESADEIRYSEEGRRVDLLFRR
jgi:anti-sigma regulatory factor (Ser/Thr protein kinase)